MIAVTAINYEAVIIDTSGKEGAHHSIDIITAISIGQYWINCAEAYKNLGMFLIMVKIYKFLNVFVYDLFIQYSNKQLVY